MASGTVLAIDKHASWRGVDPAEGKVAFPLVELFRKIEQACAECRRVLSSLCMVRSLNIEFQKDCLVISRRPERLSYEGRSEGRALPFIVGNRFRNLVGNGSEGQVTWDNAG